MRRTLFGLAVAALTVLALAGPASAAAGQVHVFRFQGTFAGADWVTSSPTSFTETLINVSQSNQGSELYVEQSTGSLNGTFTQTIVDVTSGFSFTIDQPKLASASTSGSGLPGETCTYDAEGNQIGCSPTTMDVNASWTGQGPINRSVSNGHVTIGMVRITDHSTGTSRTAMATGTAGGVTLSADELQFAELGTARSGEIKVCIGCQAP